MFRHLVLLPNTIPAFLSILDHFLMTTPLIFSRLYHFLAQSPHFVTLICTRHFPIQSPHFVTLYTSFPNTIPAFCHFCIYLYVISQYNSRVSSFLCYFLIHSPSLVIFKNILFPDPITGVILLFLGQYNRSVLQLI